MRKVRRSRTSRGNIADLTNPLRHGAPPPDAPAAAAAEQWSEGAPGWRIDRSICEAGAPVLVELVHEDGRRLALVPQEAALRVLAQGDPLGRFVGSAFAEVFTAFRRLDKGVPPQQVAREARAHGAVAMLDIAAETLADRAAKTALHTALCSHKNVATDHPNIAGRPWRTCLDCGARIP